MENSPINDFSADVLPHVGRQIRHYRRARGLTLDELARRIHKSKGSLSKYESGRISMDISTLFDIAWALEIEPRCLIDLPTARRRMPEGFRSPFGEGQGVLHLYHMRDRELYSSLIELRPVEGKMAATLFYVVKDPADPHDCICIYEGEMHAHDTVLCFTLQNYLTPVENLLLNFTVPMRKVDTLSGLISGLGASTLTPACFPGVLSPAPLPDTEALREKLTIPKASIAEARRRNVFSLTRDQNEL